MEKSRIETISLLVLFAGVSFLLFCVFAPFLQALALAVVFAVLSHGAFKKLTRIFGGWKTPAAAIIVTIVIIFFIAPLFLFGIEIFREVQGIYASMQSGGVHSLVSGIQALLQDPLQRVFPGFTFDINTYIVNALGFISSNLAGLVYQTISVIFETFLMVLALFFFLRDGDKLFTGARDMSPLGTEVTANILKNLQQAMQSVVKGTLVIALIRWIVVGIGFYLFGIPNAILWGSIGGVVGAVPGVGTPAVFLPAIVFLFLSGHTLAAVGLTIFAVLALVLLDNMLTPYFFSKGLAAPQLFILFSILGGIIFFGPLGFIFGPLVLSVFLSVFSVYSRKSMDSASS